MTCLEVEALGGQASTYVCTSGLPAMDRSEIPGMECWAGARGRGRGREEGGGKQSHIYIYIYK